MGVSVRAVLGAVAVSLLVPAAAHAATKPVLMGPPAKASAELQKKYAADANAFFPSSITIVAGDSVAFTPAGFHNAELPKKGAQPSAFAAPQGPISGANDPAGAPYWFNGQVNFGFNPALVTKSLFGKKATYTGAATLNTGLPLAPKPKPAKVKFPKAGSYSYFCSLHPGMKGTVKVLRKGRKAPSAKADAKRVAKQAAAAIKTAKALAARKSTSANTIEMGVESGSVWRLAFLPDTLSVPVGTTVTFKMPAVSREAHTASTGPGDPAKEPKSFLGTLAASLESPTFDPQVVYRSEAPGTVADLTPSLHGNGFWNSGILDAVAASPLPSSDSVRFAAAGTYKFFCLIHPPMVATVTVT